MKVLQICAYAAPYAGNFIKSLLALEKELSTQGVETIYAFPELAREQAWCQELRQNHQVYFLPLAKARLKLQTYRAIRKIFCDNPDLKIVHSHFELYDFPIIITAPRHVKVFWHLHDNIELDTDLKSRLVKMVQYRFFHRHATLICLSEMHRRYLEKIGFPAAQIVRIPNGVDLHRLDHIELTPQKKYDFLLFGWQYQRKGVDLAIKALKQSGLTERKLTIVGNDNTAPQIKAEFGKIPPNVEVIPPQSNIAQLYAQTSCFLHISRAEGMSYALLEVIYAGLPVICSDIEVNQLAAEFRNVHMIKSENVAEIAQAMSACLHNPLPEDIAYNRQKIQDEYSTEVWAKNISQLYQKHY